FAQRIGGTPYSGVTEGILAIPSTAHILGGAVIGSTPEAGGVDTQQRAFGYENLLVTAGAAGPAQLRANPSPTIHAAGGRARPPASRAASVAARSNTASHPYEASSSSDAIANALRIPAGKPWSNRFAPSAGPHSSGACGSASEPKPGHATATSSSRSRRTYS